MRKQVFLFELDSIRDSKEEIERAQKALFEEIILNGNTVVLSFNQLSDSRGFLRSLVDKETAEQIAHLFELGHLKVAQYQNEKGELVRTASQYFQQALAKNAEYSKTSHNAFHFSTFDGLGLKNEDYEDIQRALTFCDLPLLASHLYSEEELLNEDLSPQELDQRKENNLIWTYIMNVISLIITMSQSEFAIVEPAASQVTLYDAICCFCEHQNIQDQEEQKGALAAALEAIPEKGVGYKALLEIITSGEVYEIMKKIDSVLVEEDNRQSRSLWKNHILDFLDQSEGAARVADLVIDLLYNYVIEDGIDNICKHYSGEIGSTSFWKDFAVRLAQYWEDSQPSSGSCNKIHYYYKETRPEISDLQRDTSIWVLNPLQLAPWETADHIVEKIGSIQTSSDTYEQTYFVSRMTQKKYLRNRFLRMIGSICASIVLFVIINTVLGWVQGLVEIDSNGVILLSILFALLSTIVFSLLGSFISNKIQLTDILDSCGNFCTTIKDIFVTKKQPRNVAYRRASEDKENKE